MARAGRTSVLRALVAAALLSLYSLALPSSVAAASAGVSSQHRVGLRVFFRAFCPACQWFVGDPLLELVRTEEFRNIVDLTLIPAAGMTEKDGAIQCEAGPLECTGHRWQVCVLDKDRDDVVKYLGTIACIEGDESGRVGDWPTKMQNCLTDEERVVVKECFDDRSKELLLEMIRTDHAGSVPWMPYTIVEQKVLGSASEGVGLKTLQSNICAAYKGPKSFYPPSCVKLIGEQKEFAEEETAEKEGDAPLVAAGENPAEAKPDVETQRKEAEKEVAAPVEGGDGDLVVDIKEEPENAAPAEPANVPVKAAGTGKVKLNMYWRAFCPGCMSFITKPLLALVRDKEFQEIIDFQPVPAAGTSFDAEGNFVCTAGLVECLGHKWLSCAVEEFPEIGDLTERLGCMESKDNKGYTWSFIVNRCFEGETFTKMKNCYDTKSDDLLRKNVAKRRALSVPWVPYVLINDVPLGDATHGIGLKQLMDAVCKAYSGPDNLWPKACQPKRLREEAEAKPVVEDVVKPCAPKKKDGENAQGAQYEDPPGIGKRLATDTEAETVTEFEAKVFGGNQPSPDEEDEGGVSLQGVVLPGVCLVGVIFVALRLTADHKKDA